MADINVKQLSKAIKIDLDNLLSQMKAAGLSHESENDIVSTEDKKVLILDEPTENLDAESKAIFSNEIVKYKNNKTIILISHNHDDLKICDKIFDLGKNLN